MRLFVVGFCLGSFYGDLSELFDGALENIAEGLDPFLDLSLDDRWSVWVHGVLLW